MDIEFLLNKEQYAKLMIHNSAKDSIKAHKDRKFYKKRIYDMTKQLLSGELTDIYPDVNRSFENYVNTCVSYFKAIDRSDIIQSDYACVNTDTLENMIVGVEDDAHNNILDISGSTLENANHLMLRSIRMDKQTPLDKMVVRNVTKTDNEPIIPKQKKIDLRTPDLKTKGIKEKDVNKKLGKKKNIGSIYDKNVISDEKKIDEKK